MYLETTIKRFLILASPILVARRLNILFMPDKQNHP